MRRQQMTKHPGGKPTKYKSEMCITAIDMMRMRASKVEVAAILDINRDTLFSWINDNKKLSDAIKEGETLCQAWWEG